MLADQPFMCKRERERERERVKETKDVASDWQSVVVVEQCDQMVK